MKLVLRRSDDRGIADHGWLKTFHTFSFNRYRDSQHDHYGCLRVLNEDRVESKAGFGTHAHRELEIFSYIVNGALEHRDSKGNTEIMKRGDIQMSSAGTGIRHSEHTHGDQQVHFIQIWSTPTFSGLQPQYFFRHFSDEDKRDRWAHIVAPVDTDGVVEERKASGPTPIHSRMHAFATLMSPERRLAYTFFLGALQRKGFVHVVQTSGYNSLRAKGARVRLLGAEGGPVEMREGDGVYIMAFPGEDLVIENVGDQIAEVLLFDME